MLMDQGTPSTARDGLDEANPKTSTLAEAKNFEAYQAWAATQPAISDSASEVEVLNFQRRQLGLTDRLLPVAVRFNGNEADVIAAALGAEFSVRSHDLAPDISSNSISSRLIVETANSSIDSMNRRIRTDIVSDGVSAANRGDVAAEAFAIGRYIAYDLLAPESLGDLARNAVLGLGTGKAINIFGSVAVKLFPILGKELSFGLKSLASQDGKTVIVYRVDDLAFSPRIAADGSIPVVRTGSGEERALFINIGQPARAAEFAEKNRNGNAVITSMEVPVDFLKMLRASSVYDKSPAASLLPKAPLRVDTTKAPDQFGLRTSEQIQMLREAIKQNTVKINNPKTMKN